MPSTTNIRLDAIEEAIKDIKEGKIIIVVDDENRENEGDFVAAADKVTPEMINFMATNGRGLICTPITEKRCKELNLDLMVGINTDPLGTAFTVSVDYHGKFKLAWDSQYLYVLVEVIDEYLNPTLGNGIENYWKGDYVEVFIDEDKSGGLHQFNHQAFAYHVSTEGHAIDKSESKETIFFDDHIRIERLQEGNRHLWEMAIKLFDNQFDENSTDNIPVKIVNQKSIGFSIAYGDNDGNNSRENFMGSKKTHGINNDEGYINADVFGSILFIE